MLRILILSLAIVVAIAIGFCFKSFTPPIFSENSIASLKKVTINGDSQYLLLRGQNKEDPVILFLHGGPGMPAMYLAHDFQRELENHFVVVHWDQRGSGKSYRKSVTPEELSISTLLNDTDAVVEYLRKELAAEKIWIVGHSHGSYLGALYAASFPEKVSAYVGLGQVADFSRESQIQDEFLSDKLSKIGWPSDTEITSQNREELLFLTGSELHGETSFIPLIMSGLKATEYNLFDIMNVAKGSSFSSANMTYDHTRNLIADKTNFETPVAIIMGEYDMTTPLPLAEEYFEAITAPKKEWVLVSEAAHFPHFEHPTVFTSEMVRLKEAWN